MSIPGEDIGSGEVQDNVNIGEATENEAEIQYGEGTKSPELSIKEDSIFVTDPPPESTLSVKGTAIDADELSGNPFDDDKAELKYLISKPTCFFIVGKPGIGKSTLAEKLAEEWKTQLINPTALIDENIAKETAKGMEAKDILDHGGNVYDKLVFEMLEDKFQSEEINHYGYVLDGLPCLNEDVLSCHQQIELVKNCRMPPDIIINLRISDSDLQQRRAGMKVDPVTNITYTKNQYDPPKPEITDTIEDEGEEEEDDDEDEEEPEVEEEEEKEPVIELEDEVKDRLVTRPEDFPEEIQRQIQNYRELLLRPLEDYMANHDPQYVIQLDALITPTLLFKALMSKLVTLPIRVATVPIRLMEPGEEEEVPEDIDYEETMRQLAQSNMLGPRWRWRRSRWGRYCPVSLSDGNVITGRSEWAVAFLDKIYMLANEDAHKRFVSNPRPFILPPAPKPPCKISVVGPPLSGKSTLCKLLALKYNAKVLKVEELIEPRLEESRNEAVEKVRIEATERAIADVKEKYRVLQEQEKADAEELSDADDITGDEIEADKVDDVEEQNDDDLEKQDGKVVTDEKEDATLTKSDEVDESHPEVVEAVQSAIEEAQRKIQTLSPEEISDIIASEIEKVETRLRELNPYGQKTGGYILDNYPTTINHWNAFIDKGLIVDDVICLQDMSDGGQLLLDRWWGLNKLPILEEIQNQRKEEERVKNEEEAERKRIEDAERAALEEQRLKAIQEAEEEAKENLEPVNEEDGDAASSRAASEHEEDETQVKDADISVASKGDIEDTTLSETKEVDLDQEGENQQEEEEVIPVEHPVVVAYLKEREEFEKEWGGLSVTISTTSAADPKQIDINEKSEIDVFKDTHKAVQGTFSYVAWEYTGIDMDEEEEDIDADQDEDDTLADEEEDEDAIRNRKRPFGDSKHYDPVILNDKGSLVAGTNENAAKYKEKTIYFTTPENRDAFLENPTKYLGNEKSTELPPPRIFILGTRGAGKTSQGRKLANELGIFHISFRERLQELIIAKTKKKIGPEFDEDGPDEENEEKDEDKQEEDGVPSDEIPEPEIELTEEEESIKAYLAEGEPLTQETLDSILSRWWNTDPFKSKGFILEGFPNNQDEVTYLQTSSLFPDTVIILQVEDQDVSDRLLPARLLKWQTKRNVILEKRRAAEEKRKTERVEAIEKRRQELIAEKNAKKAEDATQEDDEDSDYDDDEDVEEEGEEDEIEAQLAEEFEEDEPEDDEDEEQEPDAIDRMRTEISDRYEEETGRLQQMQELLAEILITTTEVNAARKPHIVYYLLKQKLKTIVDARENLLEMVYPVSKELAKRMIEVGYKHLSTFGKWDPVLLTKNEVMQPYEGNSHRYPVVYRSHIFYLSSLEHRNQFIEQPNKFLRVPPPPPVVPMRIAVVGPPKSGKTSLAQRFSAQYGMVRLSIGDAMRTYITNYPRSELTNSIKQYLKRGVTVPDELAIQALEVALLDIRCQTRGYILDGYPLTKEQVELLTARQITPMRIIELDIEDEQVYQRGSEDRRLPKLYPMHDSHKILCVKVIAYRKESTAVRKWYEEQHNNYNIIDGNMSKWSVWHASKTIASESVAKVQTYLDRTNKGQAACIHGLCVTQNELEARIGEFGHYCPVSLASGKLYDASHDIDMEFTAEFRGRYFKTAGPNELATFIDNASQFVAPMAPTRLPEPHLLPRRRCELEVKALFPLSIAFKGYCCVAYIDGESRYENIIPGKPELVVEYRNNLYYFGDENALQRFMEWPERYWDAKLPHKLPPIRTPLEATRLPILGYMEQTVAKAVIQSMTEVGNYKPKYPFMSVTQSALMFIAYSLKAHNPKATEYVRRKYKQKLVQFKNQCELVHYLGNHMTMRYKAPHDRPIDFDFKMTSFFALEDSVPTHSWIK